MTVIKMFVIRKEEKDVPKIPKIDNKEIAGQKPKNEQWQPIHDAADDQTSKMVRKIEKTVEETKNKVNESEMIDGINANDQYKIVASIPFDDFDKGINEIENIVKIAFVNAGKGMIIYLPVKYRDFKFDSATPRAIDYVKRRGADLVVEIGENTRNAIRIEIDKALKEGLSVDVTAKNIKNLIGLTERQAGAVTNFRKKMIASDVSQSRIDSYSKKYAERLLKYRAENIARTELMTAANQGHLEMINQLVDQGLVVADEVVRVWIVTLDDRLCKYCEPMNNQTTTINGFFNSGLGQLISPPLHPQCRCTTGIEIK